ncbi:lytic transglycosylase domain-containing protein [Sporolactobacillus shoreae]|uniref:Lytic transglycosylase domain-containing protein n=1 Tax=Sporolactobacillus shoreae TaxID=1465501 RepID=A0A4Z0GRT8_9BACL|nr:lytic transglycosylase domain-containing protein [Sporolactobacillus shoreae]TGB00103.1 lytic transglycosylase domain-containing protein [Sporolactobacillus shoreae]
MALDPGTLSKLISMNAMDSFQNQSDLLSSSTASGSNFSDLLSLLMLMMQRDTGINSGLPNSGSSATPSGTTGNSTADSDALLWQQMASASPLSLASGVNGTLPATVDTSSDLENAGSDKISDYSKIINEMSQKYSVNPRLIESVISAESGGNSAAVSPAGALGLMQLMPGTAAALGVTDALDPAQNIEGGTKYLRQLIDKYDGSIPLALAAYNAGSGSVAKYGGIPPFPETQTYVRNILGKLQKYSI